MSAVIGDPRKAGETGPTGDQRPAGQEGQAGDPRPAGKATHKARPDTNPAEGEAKPRPKRTRKTATAT